MEVATVVLGLLTLVAAIAAAVYARQTRDDGRAPRLFLEYSGSAANFRISNPGKDAAIQIRDVGNDFNSVPQQINPSIGAVYNPQQATSRSVVAVITMRQAPGPEEKKSVSFEYVNSYGKCFRSTFVVYNRQLLKGPNLSEPYEVAEEF